MAMRPGSARVRRASSSLQTQSSVIFGLSDNDKDGFLKLTEFKKALLQLPGLSTAGDLDEDEVKVREESLLVGWLTLVVIVLLVAVVLRRDGTV